MKPHIESGPSSETIHSSRKKTQTGSPAGLAPPASPMRPLSVGRPAGNARTHLCLTQALGMVAMLSEDTSVPVHSGPTPSLCCPSILSSRGVLRSVTTGVGARGQAFPAHCGIPGPDMQEERQRLPKWNRRKLLLSCQPRILMAGGLE